MNLCCIDLSNLVSCMASFLYFRTYCIGSAFNSKGVMQCPNCRKVEKGQWLFVNGSRLYPEFSMDDWAHDEDLYDLSYTKTTLRCISFIA
ncbi:hypothetical protein Hanom_Chr11g01060131 [Helianthus anomalus]